MLSLGWLSTGNGEGSLGLFNEVRKAIDLGTVNARIEFVFCNREKGESVGSDGFLDQVNRSDIPIVSLSSSRFRSEHGGGSFDSHRVEYDKAVVNILSKFEVDVCILAGYMLILGPKLCQTYNFLNLHPALPGGPIGTWKDVIWKLIEDHSDMSGAYMHLVTEDLDKGPVVTYCSFSIGGKEHNKMWDDVKDKDIEQLKSQFGEQLPIFMHIRNEGIKRERLLIIETIKAFAEGTLRLGDLDIGTDQIGMHMPVCLDLPINNFLTRTNF